MKKMIWTLASLAALGGVAAAQPDQPQPPIGDPQPPPPDPPTPTPTPTPAPTPVAPAPPEDAETRPDAIVFGIGGGWVIPGPLDMLTTYSVRVRLLTGLTLEPRVVVRNESMGSSANPDGDTSTTNIKGGIGLRVPLIKRGKFDFELLGDVQVKSTRQPLGPDDDMRSTELDVLWGIGIAWWITPHFQFSASARNPMVRFTRNSNTMNDDTTSTKDLGAIFDPGVDVMLHVYN